MKPLEWFSNESTFGSVVRFVFPAWSLFPVFPISLCSSSETRRGSTEAAVFQSDPWLKRLISDNRQPPGPVSGAAAAALPARGHRHHYWWANQSGAPRPTRTLTLSRPHLRHRRKWVDYASHQKWLRWHSRTAQNPDVTAAWLPLFHLAALQKQLWPAVKLHPLWCRVLSEHRTLTLCVCCGNFDQNHCRSERRRASLTTWACRADTSGTTRQQACVARSKSTGSVPRLVAMLLWLLSDRRILGLCVDEFPPIESCWTDAAPCMDQNSAAGPDPARVPAGEAEQGWVGQSSVAVVSAGVHTTWAYCCLRGPDRRRTQHSAEPRLHKDSHMTFSNSEAPVHEVTAESWKWANSGWHSESLGGLLTRSRVHNVWEEPSDSIFQQPPHHKKLAGSVSPGDRAFPGGLSLSPVERLRLPALGYSLQTALARLDKGSTGRTRLHQYIT